MKYTVEGEEIDIIDDTDWDLCILIDSCRYDVFEQVYRNFFKSKPRVKKACSHCAKTKEFMQNHLNRPYVDMIYVNHTFNIGYWIPDTKFFKLVDVWETHWDREKWGTIMPWDMTDVSLKYIKKYPEKRLMVHYVQAHTPYLLKGYEEFNKIEYTPERCLDGVKKGKKDSRRWNMFYQGVMRRYLGYERTWRWLLFMGIEPSDYFGRVYKKFGMKGLIDGYRDNMKIVLKEAKRLIDNSGRKKILISADHSQTYTGDRKNMRQELIPWLERK